jgi:hypothetical protein
MFTRDPNSTLVLEPETEPEASSSKLVNVNGPMEPDRTLEAMPAWVPSGWEEEDGSSEDNSYPNLRENLRVEEPREIVEADSSRDPKDETELIEDSLYDIPDSVFPETEEKKKKIFRGLEEELELAKLGEGMDEDEERKFWEKRGKTFEHGEDDQTSDEEDEPKGKGKKKEKKLGEKGHRWACANSSKLGAKKDGPNEDICQQVCCHFQCFELFRTDFSNHIV